MRARTRTRTHTHTHTHTVSDPSVYSNTPFLTCRVISIGGGDGGGRGCTTYQTLLAEQAEEQGVAHLPEVLEADGLQLSVLHDVLQLVVEELQDTWGAIMLMLQSCLHVLLLQRWTCKHL